MSLPMSFVALDYCSALATAQGGVDKRLALDGVHRCLPAMR